MEKTVLPSGFHDLLFPESEIQEQTIHELLQHVRKFGYQLVEPPFIEFEDSLFAGMSRDLEDNSFRLMDPNSHKMMAIRPDITAQVARIASSRLDRDPLPLRLSYAGQVFRVSSDGVLNTHRQQVQAGIELIGSDSPIADAEILIITLSALIKFGVRDICVDFNFSNIVDLIIDKLSIPQSDHEDLRLALYHKDAIKIAQIIPEQSEFINKLISPGLKIEHLREFKILSSMQSTLDRLEAVIKCIESRIEGINISITPVEKEYSYHKDITFSIYARGINYKIARGGRYLIESEEDKSIDAVGITLYTDSLFSILSYEKTENKILVPADTSQNEINKLQDDGYVTITSFSGDLEPEAKNLKCNFIYFSKKIKKI
ncbi:ATP phosphoribosyltransferase regulatory subunit [Rickettsiales bacterium]|nr:ATP phosphoribosyltransferase regulatory subunit [Rickettsiales bacterium]